MTGLFASEHTGGKVLKTTFNTHKKYRAVGNLLNKRQLTIYWGRSIHFGELTLQCIWSGLARSQSDGYCRLISKFSAFVIVWQYYRNCLHGRFLEPILQVNYEFQYLYQSIIQVSLQPCGFFSGSVTGRPCPTANSPALFDMVTFVAAILCMDRCQ